MMLLRSSGKGSADLLCLLLLLKLFDLLTLLLKLLLLPLDRLLSLLLLGFVVLHRVAYHVSCAGSQRSANRSSGGRMTHGRADDRTTTRTD